VAWFRIFWNFFDRRSVRWSAVCSFDHTGTELVHFYAYVQKAVAGNARRRLGMQRILGGRPRRPIVLELTNVGARH
jgi:hypothetical protein